jgi:hypothetical protein
LPRPWPIRLSISDIEAVETRVGWIEKIRTI